MKSSDLDARNAGNENYWGYVDVDFLPGTPFVMFTNNDCSVAFCVHKKGNFEAASLKLWCGLVRDATAVLDVGAYTGIYALAAASNRSDLTVHAFEPNPFTMARLRANITVNELWNIQDHFCGVGETAGLGKISWLRKPSRTLSSGATFAVLHESFANKTETAHVQIRNLNDPEFCAGLGARPLIKVDVEGVEAFVFRGMTALLQRQADVIFETFDAGACDEINARIDGLGYSVYFINEKEGRLERRDRVMPCDPRSESMNQFLTARANPEAFLG